MKRVPISRGNYDGKACFIKDKTDISELDGHFYYTPSDGEIRHSHGPLAGRVAGEVRSDGYKRVSIGKLIISNHRLAWALYYREWPKMQIDHIDGNKLNNRIENLRDVSTTTNLQNRKKSSKRNKSKLLGAHKCGDEWKSVIVVNGTKIYLGVFSNPIAAHRAYLAAKAKHHRGFVA